VGIFQTEQKSLKSPFVTSARWRKFHHTELFRRRGFYQPAVLLNIIDNVKHPPHCIYCRLPPSSPPSIIVIDRHAQKILIRIKVANNAMVSTQLINHTVEPIQNLLPPRLQCNRLPCRYPKELW
jgi:hypothetical protein